MSDADPRTQMQVVFHLGAHCTDEDRLLKCLLKNTGPLAAEGIIVPGPSRYRSLLREATVSLRGTPAPVEMTESLLDAVTDQDNVTRLIFSNQAFLSAPAKAVEGNAFYPQAAEKTRWLAQLFPSAGCEFHLGLRNPATFVPALFARIKGGDPHRFLAGTEPRTLRWSDTVRHIRTANPDAHVTIWCNEDTPLIWPEILRAMAMHDPQTALQGTDDFLTSIMSRPGAKRMQNYMAGHPPQNEMQRRRIVAAFLDKFALPDEIEVELDFPGWTEDLVEELTEIYEDDLFEIERMDGVTFIAP